GAIRHQPFPGSLHASSHRGHQPWPAKDRRYKANRSTKKSATKTE
ncbi:hypothetical protein K5549_018608, partial [Capra hircus]